jgi:hypothetical protein
MANEGLRCRYNSTARYHRAGDFAATSGLKHGPVARVEPPLNKVHSMDLEQAGERIWSESEKSLVISSCRTSQKKTYIDIGTVLD